MITNAPDVLTVAGPMYMKACVSVRSVDGVYVFANESDQFEISFDVLLIILKQQNADKDKNYKYM